jgi:hypothetical protein
MQTTNQNETDRARAGACVETSSSISPAAPAGKENAMPITAETKRAFWDSMDASAAVRRARAKAPWQVAFTDDQGVRRVACFCDRNRAADFQARCDLSGLRPEWVRRG